MSCCFSSSALLGLLLLFWRVLCLFGTCAGRFACRIPTWRLPVNGHVADLVTEEGGEVGIVRVDHSAPAGPPGFDGGGGIDWVSGPGGGVKRVRLNRKIQHTSQDTVPWGFSLGHVFGRD